MSGSWWFRLGLTAFFTLLACALLVWTVGGWDTETDLALKQKVRTTEGAGTARADDPPPRWATFFPESKIKLGLDLQGGIDVVLDVDVDKALETQAQRAIKSVEQGIERAGVTGATIKRPLGSSDLLVTPASPDQEEKIRGWFQESYSIYQFAGHGGEGAAALRFELAPDYEEELRTNAIQQVVESLRNRVDLYGVSEPVITAKGADQVNVQLPGVDDPQRAIKLIGTTAQLEFHLVDESIPVTRLTSLIEQARTEAGLAEDFSDDAINQALHQRGLIPEETIVLFEKQWDRATGSLEQVQPYLLKRDAVLTGDMLENAGVRSDQFNVPYVSMDLNSEGEQIFADVTGANVGKQLAIVLDNNVKSAPSIRERIAGGSARIDMGGGDPASVMREANDLSLVLRAGALPAPVYIAENRAVGATLGADSVRAGTVAMTVGALLVLLFMVVYYRTAGLIADVALATNILFLLALLAAFGATLTLPGLAGIALTVGMAVDANVIINERIREELRLGKSVRSAVAAGYDKAFSAILDGNLTTLFAGVVLFSYGTGPLKGFAVTLMIGILTTLYSAVVVSRLIFEFVVEGRGARSISV